MRKIIIYLRIYDAQKISYCRCQWPFIGDHGYWTLLFQKKFKELDQTYQSGTLQKWAGKLFARGIHSGNAWAHQIESVTLQHLIKSASYGLFTALLPCGWLYSFLLIAAVSSSPWQGSVIMFTFWLGTVPALIGSRHLIQFVIKKLGNKWGRISTQGVGLIFLSLGVLSFYERVTHLDNHEHSLFTWVCNQMGIQP